MPVTAPSSDSLEASCAGALISLCYRRRTVRQPSWSVGAPMSLKSVTSITEYLSTILEVRETICFGDPYEDVWYRGVKDNKLGLVPGAYWRHQCDEVSLVLSFRAMVPGLLLTQPADDWEWYYLMQHYGLPTRLLDWTENPLAALYFALDRADATATPCVWVLDPLALNVRSGENAILTPTEVGTPIDKWLPGNCHRGAEHIDLVPNDKSFLKDNKLPLAIFPKRHNPRIIAQRGTFTVHGAEEQSINALDLKLKDGNDGLIRIDIDPSAIQRLGVELWAVGITKTLIYPEPQSLADDLKRLYEVS